MVGGVSPSLPQQAVSVAACGPDCTLVETVRKLDATIARFTVLKEEAQREAIRSRRRAEDLEEAILEYLLWEPGRKGHAAAHRALRAVLERSTNEER